MTDDPVPLELHREEIYLATTPSLDAHRLSGAAPMVDVNVGILPGVHLASVLPDGLVIEWSWQTLELAQSSRHLVIKRSKDASLSLPRPEKQIETVRI